MQVPTTELSGEALTWAVASCEEDEVHTPAVRAGRTGFVVPLAGFVRLDYCGNPDHAWPIILREGITLECLWPLNPQKRTWHARIGGYPFFEDPNPFVAAMRCHVNNRRGRMVAVPDELVPPPAPASAAPRERG